MKTWTPKALLDERERVAKKKFTGILRTVTHPGPCVVVVNNVFVGLRPMQIAG